MASGGVLATKPPAGGTYSYSSQPRAVEQRKKYRDSGPQAQEGDPSVYGNIMYDRRIVRGNTYALHTLPASAQPDPLELQRQQEARRRALARRKAREQLRTRTPEPVDGRKHTDVQTEVYLEEITDRVIEAEVCTQTDAFLDRPPTPLFVPAKTGMDAATQIEEGDLFDFDIEVRPLLEVLVGKTVEQALMEVMEEEELAALRRQQREFEERRNAEYVEVQRLEEQERRRTHEKERRMRQQREALLKEKETSEKVAARAFAQGYLSDLVPSVFSNLSRHGFFYDTVEREIETVFIPWLMDHVQESATQQLTARTLLDGMICEILRRKFGIEEAPPPDEEGEESLEGGEQSKMVGEMPPPEATSGEDTQQVKTEEQRVFGQVGQTAEPAGEKVEGGEGLAGDSQGETLEGQPPPSASEKEEDKEPTTEEQPTTEDPPPTTGDPPPTTEDPPLATEDPPPTTGDPPPTTEDPPPTTEDPPLTTEDPPPTTKDPPTTEDPPTGEDPPSTEDPPTGEDPPSTEDSPSVEDPPTATDPPAEEATVENDNA